MVCENLAAVARAAGTGLGMARWRVGAVLIMVLASLTMVPLATHTAAAEDVVLEQGTALPPVPEGHQVGKLAMSDGWVYSGLRVSPDVGSMVVYRTAAHGNGSWNSVTDPDTDEPLVTSSMLQVDGDVIAVAGPENPDTPCPDYRVIQGATARGFAACSAPVLSRGGLVVRADAGSWIVEHPNGDLVRTMTKRPILEGDDAWTYTTGRLDGIDVVTGDSLGVRRAPVDCGPGGLIAIAGGYALVQCSTGNRSAVVDLEGQLPPWALDATFWTLGPGLAARFRATSGEPGLRLDVMDLGEGKEVRHFAAASPSQLAVDHGAAPLVAYLESATVVAVADVGPLAPRGTGPDDVVPPTIDVTGPPVLVQGHPSATVRLDWSWSGSDAEHGDALSYEIRTAEHDRGEPLVWQQPWTGFTLESYFTSASAYRFTCLQVRARDWAGNTSEWAGTPCSYVDGAGPVSTITDAALVGLPRDQLSTTPMLLRYSATDDDQVASYDITSRTALPGQGWGSWATQNTVAGSTSWSLAAGAQQCFRVRARDRVGNVGEYTNDWCASMPYDDRALAKHRGARRLQAHGALGNTVTRLARDASLTRRAVRARTVWVRAITPAYQSCPDVSVARKRIGGGVCQIAAVGDHTWYGVYAARERYGKLRIRAGHSALRVDAIAIGR